MRITAAGWARDHGAIEITDTDLNKVDVKEYPSTFSRNKPVLFIDRHGDTRNVEGIALNFGATLRLGGDYKLVVHLSKSEIAKIFYLTHKDEVDALAKSLPIVRRL